MAVPTPPLTSCSISRTRSGIRSTYSCTMAAVSSSDTSSTTKIRSTYSGIVSITVPIWVASLWHGTTTPDGLALEHADGTPSTEDAGRAKGPRRRRAPTR